MRHAGEVVTRSMLLETAWDYDFDPHDNVVDKHVHRLRGKVDRGYPQPLIHTIAGAGYMISSRPWRPVLSCRASRFGTIC